MTDIKLEKLQQEGRLQRGDRVSTQRLGLCEVVTIESVHTLSVKTLEGQCFRISGLSFGAGTKVVST